MPDLDRLGRVAREAAETDDAPSLRGILRPSVVRLLEELDPRTALDLVGRARRLERVVTAARGVVAAWDAYVAGDGDETHLVGDAVGALREAVGEDLG